MVRSEEEAYEKIAEELGVKTLKLGYMPEGMYFEKLIVDKGYTKLQYKYKDSNIFFIQAKSSLRTSITHASDTNEKYEIWNAGLHINIKVCDESVKSEEWAIWRSLFIMECITIYQELWSRTILMKY